MKAVLKLLLVTALLIGSNGCMSNAVLKRTKGKPDYTLLMLVTPEPDGQPHPGYYPLLIATVPLDVATLPIQAIGFAFGYMLFTGLGSTP